MSTDYITKQNQLVDEAVTLINTALSDISEHFTVTATREELLGRVMCVQIVSPWKVTRHNANLLIDLMMHLQDHETDNYKFDKISCNREAKYRKSGAASPYIAANNLVTWVVKNLGNLNTIAQTKRW